MASLRYWAALRACCFGALAKSATYSSNERIVRFFTKSLETSEPTACRNFRASMTARNGTTVCEQWTGRCTARAMWTQWMFTAGRVRGVTVRVHFSAIVGLLIACFGTYWAAAVLGYCAMVVL